MVHILVATVAFKPRGVMHVVHMNALSVLFNLTYPNMDRILGYENTTFTRQTSSLVVASSSVIVSE